jgi:hypothetical protein
MYRRSSIQLPTTCYNSWKAVSSEARLEDVVHPRLHSVYECKAASMLRLAEAISLGELWLREVSRDA